MKNNLEILKCLWCLLVRGLKDTNTEYRHLM
jgi:hypothetical protein